MTFINLNSIVIDDSTVVLDPWDYGVDGNETQTRHTQVFMYMRNPKNDDTDSNHYCFPLDFMIIVDVCAMKVKRIIRLLLGQKIPPRTTLKLYQVVQSEGASFTVTVTGHRIESNGRNGASPSASTGAKGSRITRALSTSRSCQRRLRRFI